MTQSVTRRRSALRLGLPALALGLVAALANVPANAAPVPDDQAGILMNYTVNSDSGGAAMADVKDAVEAAGGTVLSQYAPIGVTVAQSSRNAFARDLRAQRNLIDSVGATRTSAVDADLEPKIDFEDSQRVVVDPEPREDEQWGNEKLEVLEAHAIEDGKRSVTVAILDSGLEDRHEDLQANFDREASVDCVSGNGVPNTANGAWRPTSSTHGTHVSGTIGAARNGIGIAGIAPGAKIAGIKVANDDGFYFAEYVLCGFWWALQHGVEVTNHSYYMDPWYFWCPDDPDQGAVLESMRRMIKYTQDEGVIHVAAAGNSSIDLAHKTTDSSSPNDSEPIIGRPVDGCFDIPTELKGVVTVSAIQQSGTLASFSNYGKNVIDVSAPGVSILSTVWPGTNTYGFLSGTSMASPHVAGVIALIESSRPGLPLKKMMKVLNKTSVDTPCGGAPNCQGTPSNNGYYGHGVVNALNAVE